MPIKINENKTTTIVIYQSADGKIKVDCRLRNGMADKKQLLFLGFLI